MADLTDEELAFLRAKVGDKPADDQLQEIFDREGSKEKAALWILENRLANYLSRPGSQNIPGQYSDSVEANIRALQGSLKGLTSVVDEADPNEGSVMFTAPIPPRR
jgi:hypothetical protein